MNQSTTYRPDIDGLRAVAVLGVLLGHAGLGLSGGYAGVDVFFVISGYLITELILKDLDAGTFTLQNFWERRVRRIMPALVAVVLATLIAGWFRLLPQDFGDLGKSVLAQAMLVSNYYFYTVSGYFEETASQKPLLHTWSLAVEEQFYVLFPLLLMLLHRWSRRLLIPALALIGAASFAMAVRWSHTHAWANFYFLPTRAWELLLGALLAVLPVSMAAVRWVREACAVLGLTAILAAMVCFDRQTPMPGLPALLPCGGAVLIIGAGRGLVQVSLPLAGRLLAWVPLVFIGLISYSLYLWHWPLLVLAQYWDVEPLSASSRWLLVLGSIGLAVLSWRWVETPFRQRRVLPMRRHVFMAAGGAAMALTLAGISIVWLKGVPSRLPETAQHFAEGSQDLAFGDGISLDDALNGRFTELGAGDRSKPVQILVWGDSHAMAVMPVIDQLCRDHGVRGLGAAHAATAPLINYRLEHPDSLLADGERFNTAVIRFAIEHHIPHVLMVARWDSYLMVNHGRSEPLAAGLRATMRAFKDSSPRLWIMPTVPACRGHMPKLLAWAVIHGSDPQSLGTPVADYQRTHQVQMDLFNGAMASAPHLAVLDPAPLMTGSQGLCLVAAGGFSLYRDFNHLSIHGALHLCPLFEPLFQMKPAE